jgi:hypothetical protein
VCKKRKELLTAMSETVDVRLTGILPHKMSSPRF